MEEEEIGHDDDAAASSGNTTNGHGRKKGWDVTKLLAKAGERENVKVVTGEEVLELTLEDVMGGTLGSEQTT